MALLLSWAQQLAIKPISANNQSKYAQIAAEVEVKELRDLLGVGLLQDVQTNPTSAENVILLDGGSYENCNGQTITFKGLRFVIAYLNYAKYAGSGFITDTFTGIVQKNRPESQLISEGTMKRLINENREIALQEWELIKEFLDLNYETYTLWSSLYSKKPFTPRIYGIKKTVN